MSDPRNQTDTYGAPPVLVRCCLHLRTKSIFYDPEEMRAGPGFIRVDDCASYWCNRSGAAFGPDDEPSGPRACQCGRSCFAPRE